MKSYHESEITKSVEKVEIKDANLDLNPIVKLDLRNIKRMAEKSKSKQKQKQFHRMKDVNKQIDSEIEEHCDETLLKKEELKSQVSESDDDDIPDFETENQIELSVGNKIRCFKKDYEVESKEFNKVFDIKKEVQREPTENSVDNSSEEVANTQSKFKQVSTESATLWVFSVNSLLIINLSTTTSISCFLFLSIRYFSTHQS